MTGEVLPGRFPDLADAVTDGAAAARAIMNLCKDVHLRADRDALDTAMTDLLQAAKTTDLVGLEQVGWHSSGALDPDRIETAFWAPRSSPSAPEGPNSTHPHRSSGPGTCR